MRGASRWLEALAVGTPGERSSAPRPSAAHAPMTDRDGALPCNFMCPSFRPPTLRTHAPERISAAPPGPFAPPTAHQYLRGGDPRGRCSVKRTAIILAAALAVTTARCGRGDQETAPAPSERPAIRSVRITMAALHPGGRRPTRLALHRAPGRHRGGTADLRRRRLPLLPPRRSRGVSAADRPGPGADGHGQPSSRRVLRRVDPHPRRRPGRRAGLHRAGRALRHAELSGSDAPPARRPGRVLEEPRAGAREAE